MIEFQSVRDMGSDWQCQFREIVTLVLEILPFTTRQLSCYNCSQISPRRDQALPNLIWKETPESPLNAIHKTVLNFKSIVDRTSLNPVTIQMPDGSIQTSQQSKEFNSSELNEKTLTFNVNGFMELEVYFENTYNIESMGELG